MICCWWELRQTYPLKTFSQLTFIHVSGGGKSNILPSSSGFAGNANIYNQCKVDRSGRCLRRSLLSTMWCLCMTSMLQEVNSRLDEQLRLILLRKVMCDKCSCVRPPVTSNDQFRNFCLVLRKDWNRACAIRTSLRLNSRQTFLFFSIVSSLELNPSRVDAIVEWSLQWTVEWYFPFASDLKLRSTSTATT